MEEPESPRSPGSFKAWGGSPTDNARRRQHRGHRSAGSRGRSSPSQVLQNQADSTFSMSGMTPVDALDASGKSRNQNKVMWYQLDAESDEEMQETQAPAVPRQKSGLTLGTTTVQPLQLQPESSSESSKDRRGLKPALVLPIRSRSNDSEHGDEATTRVPLRARRNVSIALEGIGNVATPGGPLLNSPAASASERGSDYQTPSRSSGTVSQMGGLRARRGLALTLTPASAPNATSPVGPPGINVTKVKSEPAIVVRPKSGLSKTMSSESDFGDGSMTRRRTAAAPGVCRSPESKQSAVHLMFRTTVSKIGLDGPDLMTPTRRHSIQHELTLRVPRPLPGAFSSRKTVIFLDWDDTLCPTSWIRSLLKETLADMEEWAQGALPNDRVVDEVDWRNEIPSWFAQPLPDEPGIHQCITDLQQTVIDLLDTAQAHGVPCIVTNAVPGWVEKTIKRWLPRLKPYILGHGSRPPVKVLYAQQFYQRQAWARGGEPSFVDETGEFTLWKKDAMDAALGELDDLFRLPQADLNERTSWCKGGSAKRIDSVISIGDSEAEMQAAEISCIDYDALKNRPPGRCVQSLWLNSTSSASGMLRLVSKGSAGSGESSDHAGRMGSNESTSGPVVSSPSMPLLAPSALRDIPRGPGRFRNHSVDADALWYSHWPWVKLVKFRECSHVRQLVLQLEDLCTLLPGMVFLRQNIRVDFGVASPTSPSSPLTLQPRCNTGTLRPQRSVAEVQEQWLPPEANFELGQELRVQDV